MVTELVRNALGFSWQLITLSLMAGVQDVAYAIGSRSGGKSVIIQGVTGCFEPGEMTAVVSLAVTGDTNLA